MAIQVLGSLFDLFLAWENGALFTLKSPERVGAERKRLANEVGAVLGLLGASGCEPAGGCAGRKFNLGACRCPQIPRSSGGKGRKGKRVSAL
jgi:hypothetical protein